MQLFSLIDNHHRQSFIFSQATAAQGTESKPKAAYSRPQDTKQITDYKADIRRKAGNREQSGPQGHKMRPMRYKPGHIGAKQITCASRIPKAPYAHALKHVPRIIARHDI